jgi:hypothetical protein
MNTFPVTSYLLCSFRKIGARVRAVPPMPTWLESNRAVNITVRKKTFEIMLPLSGRAVVLDCCRQDHHLVLSLQAPGFEPERFLCGFDEHHWFVAAVTGETVLAAKESLMPHPVREAAVRFGVRRADLFRRRTKAFIRQGEWFFVPAGDIEVDPLMIHRREPLIRPGGGKPHIVDELIRGTGTMVWHHEKYAPNGFTDSEYECLLEPVRKATGWSRRMRVRDGDSVLARGAVRHSDHAPIWLSAWHRVYINNELRPDSLGFFD